MSGRTQLSVLEEAQALRRRAEDLRAEKSLAAAEQSATRGCSLLRAAPVLGGLELADLLNELGTIQLERYELAAASATAAEAFVILERLAPGIQGGQPARVCVDMLRLLGTIRFEQGRLDEAEPLLRAGLTLAAEAFGPGSSEACQQVPPLLRLYRRMGALERAIEVWQQAWESAQAEGGLGTRPCAPLCRERSELALAAGDESAAEQWALRAYSVREAELGTHHPLTLDAAVAWARALDRQGRSAESVPLYRSVMAAWEHRDGTDCYGAADAMVELGRALADTGDLDEAEQLLRRAHTVKKRHLGAHHPETTEAALPLVLFLHERRGWTAEAHRLFAPIYSAMRSLLPKLHPQRTAAAALWQKLHGS